MGVRLHRKDRIDRIEVRIDGLRDQATDLLRRERSAAASLEHLEQLLDAGAGRLRRRRLGRSVHRAQARLERVSERRTQLVEVELRSIMMALEQQSRRTRERLDRELERLVPVEAEWERLRSAFDTLEATVATPAIEDLAGQWRGGLEIPEFPVREGEGYARPFPQGALLF